MIAMMSPTALRMSHWIAPNFIRDSTPASAAAGLRDDLKMNHSALPLPLRALVVGSTIQKGVSKVSYREVKAAEESGGFRHLFFLEAALDQRAVDRELRKQRARRRACSAARLESPDSSGRTGCGLPTSYPRQPYDAGEQRHHLGVLAGVRDPSINRRHPGWGAPAGSATGLLIIRRLTWRAAWTRSPRKAVQAGVVAFLDQGNRP
jgi:hypothetical protein